MLDRRDFIKLGLLCSTIIVTDIFSNSILSFADQVGVVNRSTGQTLNSIPSTCLCCPARCGILCFVRYGELIKIGGNPEHPNNRGKLCSKGQAGVYTLYDTERILYPMKRTGERWQRISWDEAYQEIIARLQKIQNDRMPEGLAFLSERDITTQAFIRKFMDKFNSSNYFNLYGMVNPNKERADRLIIGATPDVPDILNTDFILIFGANPLESSPFGTGILSMISEAKAKNSNLKIVTFDPRCSKTAGRSDEWIPLRPGTDGMVALAMANIILKEGLHEKKFSSKWIDYPEKNIRQFLSGYTPELAERISSVNAVDIMRIAKEFSLSKKALIISGGGVGKHERGFASEQAIWLLRALTGRIGSEGGNLIPSRIELGQGYSEDIGNGEKAISIIRDKEIDTLILYEANPAYFMSARFQKLRKKIPFIVNIDTHFTETALMSDIILPSTTYLERFEIESVPSITCKPLVSLRQPAVKPLGECKSIIDIFLDMSRHIGGRLKESLNYKNSYSYWTGVISSFNELQAAGGMYYLKEHGVWVSKENHNCKLAMNDGFKAESKENQVYMKKGFDPLPAYITPDAYKGMKENEFILLKYQVNVHTTDRTANNIYLQEIAHSNPVFINSGVARKLSIKKWDKVAVRSKNGSLMALAVPTPGIHPRAIAMADNCGHTGWGNIARGKAFSSQDPATECIWWERDGLSSNINSLIEYKIDPAGGGAGWMDTKITLEKVRG